MPKPTFERSLKKDSNAGFKVANRLSSQVLKKTEDTSKFGKVSTLSFVTLIIILGIWGTGMTLMLLFGDRLSQRLIVQNSEMQDAYEQRLQSYRAEISRVIQETEQSKFEQNSVEGKIFDLGRRQRLIETRLQALNRLSELVAPGAAVGAPSLNPITPVSPIPEPPARDIPRAPSLTSPSGRTNQPRINKSQLDSDVMHENKPFIQLAQLGAGSITLPYQQNVDFEIESMIDKMTLSIQNAEQIQSKILNSMAHSSEARVNRLRVALNEIGMTPEGAITSKGRGEPDLPSIILPVSDEKSVFADRVKQVRSNFGLVHRLRYTIDALPIFNPTLENVRFSSGFGYRLHPILGTRKLHAGIDMAAPIGTPVKAAGAGIVLSAGWGGGYGNLVQIDHGNGVITRYAHLSQIDTVTGQPISVGTQIGLMGTTGASTGSHLHFETRLNGSPTNPACFLLAGDKISGKVSIPLTCDKPPNWSRTYGSEEEDSDG